MDTAELGRCHAPIKSRRPVLCVRRAAHQPQATTARFGHLLSEPDPPDHGGDGDTHPLIGALNGSRSTLSSPVINSAGFAPLLNPPGMGSIELVHLATNGRRQNKVAAG